MKLLTNLVLPFLFAPILGIGQGYDSGHVYDTLGTEARAEITKQAIHDLKNGVLVVRLKTGHNQLKALERVANSPSVSPKDKERFELKIATLKNDIQQENENLAQALKDNYSFSEVIYIADTSIHLLKENIQQGYFINDKLDADPAVSLNNKNYFVGYYGSTNSASQNGVEGIVVLDRDFEELVDPFPHFTGITTTRKLLGKFFNKKNETDYFKLMVQRFESRLNEFYQLNK